MASLSLCPPQLSPALPMLGGVWRAACEALSLSSIRTQRDTGVHLQRIDRFLHFQR
jgi:hypothetical protein